MSKHNGVTPTERLLTQYCNKVFLGLWNFPNPQRHDGKELCDHMVIFDNHVLLFFDREAELKTNSDDIDIKWNRWLKKVIHAQIRSVNGAEKYVLRNESIYLDSKQEILLPVDFDPEKARVFRIIIAHGAEAACKLHNSDNVAGSIGISYGNPTEDVQFPFCIALEKEPVVHVFDSANIEIMFSELDTALAFTHYLDAKEMSIDKHDYIGYCGEEDLLATYFKNISLEGEFGLLPRDQEFNGIIIEEGSWESFTKSALYKKISPNSRSNRGMPMWDFFIKRFSERADEGKVTGDSPHNSESMILMAKEPREDRVQFEKEIVNHMTDFPDEIEAPWSSQMIVLNSKTLGLKYAVLIIKEDISKNPNDRMSLAFDALNTLTIMTLKHVEDASTVVGISMYSHKHGDDGHIGFNIAHEHEYDEATLNAVQKMNDESYKFFDSSRDKT